MQAVTMWVIVIAGIACLSLMLKKMYQIRRALRRRGLRGDK